MGLDITAYSGLRDEHPLADDDRDDPSGVVFYNNVYFPGRFDGLKEETVYQHDDSFGFRAGSYSGYNAWRSWLASIASTPQGKESDAPFAELVYFSDCEGTIGPKVSAKLAIDFQDYQAAAEESAAEDEENGGWKIEKYAAWRKAFELAANDGAVDFH